MKIAWFTPYNIQSAIARYSHAILLELQKYHEVHLWTASQTDLREATVPIHTFSHPDETIGPLGSYDLIIYNMGDNPIFHKEIYETSLKRPGIIILHDFCMHHFFKGYYLSNNNLDQYCIDLGILYGKSSINIVQTTLTRNANTALESDFLIQYPFFEKAIVNATAVITHSQFLAKKVKDCYSGPVEVIPHPNYNYSNIPNIDVPLEKAFPFLTEKNVLILTAGMLNPNKRIHRVIDVLMDNPDLARQVNYVVIGSHSNEDYATQLKKQIRQGKLESTVHLLGYQSDPILKKFLERADLCLNLRYPALEGGSGSIVEQLFFGKPSIVTKTGVYEELPDTIVKKINPQNEYKDLTRTLKEFIESQEARLTISRAAKQYANEYLTTTSYCEKLDRFLNTARYSAPFQNFVQTVSTQLSQIGANFESESLERISAEMAQLHP